MNNNFNQNQNNDFNNNFGQTNNGMTNNDMTMNNSTFNNFQGNQTNLMDNNFQNVQMPNMQNNQIIYNNQNNMYNQMPSNQTNQANQTGSQNGQFVPNNGRLKKQGTFGGMCVSSIGNFIIFTIAVFLFGGLIVSFLTELLGISESVYVMDLIKDSVLANKFYSNQVVICIILSVVYGLLYMLSIKYIVKSRFRKKYYLPNDLKKYKFFVVILTILMTLSVEWNIFNTVNSVYDSGKENVATVKEIYDVDDLEKAVESIKIAKPISIVIVLAFASGALILSFKTIKKEDLLLNVPVANNLVNANYM